VKNKFEQHLVELCAPTLAGIKVGSLFNYTSENNEDIHDIIHSWNNRLTYKGVQICLVKENEGGGLIYVFRPALLSEILLDQDVNSFLNSCGFAECYNPDTYLGRLRCHFCEESCFPHEIGVFLGYPLHDVQGFIENKGKDYALCGFWKVYSDQQRAENLFAQYRRCIATYKEMFEKGSSVLQLTIAA
jgi:hypothetical protein